MKVVKFRSYLVPLILAGEKTNTWRLFDDKDLSVGDTIGLREFGAEKSFATAVITSVAQKALGDMTEQELDDNKSPHSLSEMYSVFSEWYHQPVDATTLAKIVSFKLER
jgi:hypothetical protein